MNTTTQRTIAKESAKELSRRLVFATWSDVAPSLIHIAATVEEAQRFVALFNKLHHRDTPAVTLQDILDDPEGHGVGTDPGGWTP